MSVVYLGVPAVVLPLWFLHAGWSWSRPGRRSPFGFIVLAGLPVAAVLAFVMFANVRDQAPVSQFDPLPRGDHGDLRVKLLVVSCELALAWCILLGLESVLGVVRSSRRAPARER